MVPLAWVTSMRIAQIHRIAAPATSHSSSSITAAAGIIDGFRNITTGQPTASQQGTRAEEGDSSNTVFTGTAEVHTDKSPEEVTTDANRHWVSGDDLGTRANAAIDKASEQTGPDNNNNNYNTITNSSSSGTQQQPEAAAEVLANDVACHPADPYCTVGEAPPRPDDFHEGDGSTPPSAGFPA